MPDDDETITIERPGTSAIARCDQSCDLDARCARQQAVLRRIRDVDPSSADLVTSRLEAAIVEGTGREDLVAALWLVAHRDDIYDALAQQRQAEVLRHPDAVDLLSLVPEGMIRIGFTPMPMVVAVESITETAISAGDSYGSAEEFFLLWAGATKHAWLWEIVHAAHKRSVASRRGSR